MDCREEGLTTEDIESTEEGWKVEAGIGFDSGLRELCVSFC
jgi:hypothetical protein